MALFSTLQQLTKKFSQLARLPPHPLSSRCLGFYLKLYKFLIKGHEWDSIHKQEPLPVTALEDTWLWEMVWRLRRI